MSERLAFADFPGVPPDPALLPAPTPEQRVFEAGLAEGWLRLQACTGCSRARFPIGPVCPYCGGEAWEWRTLSGLGHVQSWVRYHRAYVPTFEAIVPYSVVAVQLDEGPWIFGRFDGGGEPHTSRRVRTVVERWPEGRCVVTFAAAEDLS